MNKDYLISKLTGFLEESKGDQGRNQYLLKRIKQNNEIINSDKIYLETLLKLKISEITENPKD